MGKKLKVTVIGGGAAGLVAAIAAAKKGASVFLFERMNRVGKKILVTGNGRCNLTNTNLTSSHYHGKIPHFAMNVINKFDLKRSLDFWAQLGITIKKEADGKIFPYSQQASSILDVLRYEISNLGVMEICDAEVVKIIQIQNGFQIYFNDDSMFTNRIILATGGKSHPQLGSNGSGYKLAASLGHTIAEPFPALVQIKLDATFLKRLKGIKIDGAISLQEEGKIIREEVGEILFTDYGVSGIPILQISREIKYLKNPKIIIDFLPEFSSDRLMKILETRIYSRPNIKLDFSFVGFIHKRVVPIILQQANIKNINKKCNDVTQLEITEIVNQLKNMEIDVKGTLSWQNSQVTAGGIATDEIHSGTMESCRIKGLYFAGEVVDVDGDSGGYNLQWAWSSGYIAGESAGTI